MNSHDRPGPATNAAPVDLNSRIEKRLWLLHKGSDKAEARMCVKFGRRDFRVYVNGQLLWSRNFAFDAAEAFDEHAAAKYAEFLADQWVAPGQPPSGE
ncbi:MAG: hypothetical protein KA371_17090 [Acidobacteria bacterium]|jgi:hypothetical protein|nr:hypothetical protein [Acidobacteriota bacterium]MCC6990946.1 hypothetical protein [Acidobacteriota bacterium]